MPPSPSRLSKSDAHTIDEFFRELEATSEQVEKLLNEVRDSEVDFAAIKTELRILCENVKDLSSILRDGDGKVSLLTKIALIEHKLAEVEKSVEKDHKKIEEQNTADKTGRWQMRVALITGTVGLLTAAVNIIIQMLK